MARTESSLPWNSSTLPAIASFAARTTYPDRRIYLTLPGRLLHLRPARGCGPPTPGDGRPRDHAGDFFAMNILPAHLAALCRLGYSDEEARFIYLVATHSGYF